MSRSACYALISMLSMVAIASAEPLFTGDKSGTWIDPVGGNSTGAGTGLLKFGAGGSLDYDAAPTFATTDNTPFRLGQLTLTNNGATNVPSQVTLKVDLTFENPNLGSANFDFATHLFTAPNGSLSASLDKGSVTTFSGANGDQYRLELLGLSSSWTWNHEPQSTVTVAECDAKTTYIWGKLSTVDPCPQVPEPTGLLLGVIGLGMVVTRLCRGKNVENHSVKAIGVAR